MDVNKIYIITLIVLGSIAGLLLIIGCFLPVYSYYKPPNESSSCDYNNTKFIQNLKIGNDTSVPGQTGCSNDGDGSVDIPGGNIYSGDPNQTTYTTICSNTKQYNPILDSYTYKICNDDLAVIDVKVQNMKDTNPNSAGYNYWLNNNEKCLFPSSTPTSYWTSLESTTGNEIINGQLCYKYDGNNCNTGINNNGKYTTKSGCDKLGVCMEIDNVSSIKNGGSYIQNGDIYIDGNECEGGYTQTPSLTKKCNVGNKYLCYKKTKYN